MSKYLAIIMLLMMHFVSSAQKTTALSDGASLLFTTTKSKLTNEEKNWLFKQLNFTLSKDKKQFMSDEYQVEVFSYVTDMNKDGIEEIFIVMKSGALFGNTGESFLLYTKNNKGGFEKQEELGGGIVMILSSKNAGYPDIASGGPGFEFPAYRWNGKKYKYFKKIKDADLQNKKVTFMDIDAYSKLYTDTLK